MGRIYDDNNHPNLLRIYYCIEDKDANFGIIINGKFISLDSHNKCYWKYILEEEKNDLVTFKTILFKRVIDKNKNPIVRNLNISELSKKDLSQQEECTFNRFIQNYTLDCSFDSYLSDLTRQE